MKAITLNIPDLLILEPPVFRDERGFFSRVGTLEVSSKLLVRK